MTHSTQIQTSPSGRSYIVMPTGAWRWVKAPQQSGVSNGAYLAVGGDTYGYRSYLKELGLRWDATRKVWAGTVTGAYQDRTIKAGSSYIRIVGCERTFAAKAVTNGLKSGELVTGTVVRKGSRVVAVNDWATPEAFRRYAA